VQVRAVRFLSVRWGAVMSDVVARTKSVQFGQSVACPFTGAASSNRGYAISSVGVRSAFAGAAS